MRRLRKFSSSAKVRFCGRKDFGAAEVDGARGIVGAILGVESIGTITHTSRWRHHPDGLVSALR